MSDYSWTVRARWCRFFVSRAQCTDPTIRDYLTIKSDLIIHIFMWLGYGLEGRDKQEIVETICADFTLTFCLTLQHYELERHRACGYSDLDWFFPIRKPLSLGSRYLLQSIPILCHPRKWLRSDKPSISKIWYN